MNISHVVSLRRRPEPEIISPPPTFTLADALFAVTLALVVFGLTMVYSASAVFAAMKFGNDTFFFFRQLAYAVFGLLLLLVLRHVSPEALRRHLRWIWTLMLIALLLVLIPGIGHMAGGARRWLSLGIAPLQPAEFAKIVVVLFLAHALARRSENRAQGSIIASTFWAEAMVVLVLCERDFGTAAILQLIVLIMLYLGDLRLRKLLVAVLFLVPIGLYLIHSSPYRMRRMTAFLDPFSARKDAGYQLSEALISIGSGGSFGVGLGDSRQKLFFLPEAHTDFIFAIIGEELGLLGVIFLATLYGAYLFVAYRIAKKQTSPFRRYLVLGFGFWVVMQAAINMAMASGLLPTKGLTLPFISSGGSSLIVCLIATGIILAAAETEASEVPS